MDKVRTSKPPFDASGPTTYSKFTCATSAPLPDFHETFPDDGYLNLYAIMRTLEDVGFDGMVVPDHVPDAHAQLGEAFTLGYIRGLIQAVTN